MPVMLKVPLFLQPDQLVQLNRKMFEQTGCFAFLKTDRILMFPDTASPQDAFMIYSICLYSLYHDYGRKFIWFFLRDDVCPDETNKLRLTSLKAHVTATEKIIRPNFAHAFFGFDERRKFVGRLTNYYLSGCSAKPPSSAWPDYIHDLGDSHWSHIAMRFIRDADNLFDYLNKWTDMWNNRADKETMRIGFASSEHFLRSIDYALCEPFLRDLDPGQIKYMLDPTNPNSQIRMWRQQMRDEFIAKKINGPDELYSRLDRIIEISLHPDAISSVDIAAKYNFDIPN